MIRRPSRCLINDILWRLSPCHPLPLEPDITNPRLVFFSLGKIIREEQAQPLDGVEPRSLDGQFLDLRGLGKLELLGCGGVFGLGEIVDVGVGEQAEGSRGRRAGGGAQEDGVEFYLGCETVLFVNLSVSVLYKKFIDLCVNFQ